MAHSCSQVDEMLCRLYEPILWRSLNVASALVRKNAATLLIDAFPIQDPTAPAEETDALMQKQFDNLAVRSFIHSLCVYVLY